MGTCYQVLAWRSGRDSSLSLLIRRYLHRVQHRPDQFATWHDRQPFVRTRPPGAVSRSSGWLPKLAPTDRFPSRQPVLLARAGARWNHDCVYPDSSCYEECYRVSRAAQRGLSTSFILLPTAIGLMTVYLPVGLRIRALRWTRLV
jgi:hypothetical protein